MLNYFKKAITAFVFSIFVKSSSITRGNYFTLLTLCPLAITREGIAEAAKAEAKACLFCFRFTFLCHLLNVFNGKAIAPFLHMLPKAAYPDL